MELRREKRKVNGREETGEEVKRRRNKEGERKKREWKKKKVGK